MSTNDGKVHRPMEGVAVYFEPVTGAGVLITHHIADPLKRSLKWRRETATDPAFAPDGELSPKFAEEYDLSFTAARAKLIYYRWAERYNVVEPFDPIERGFTRWVLAWDFGDYTACMFCAQNPRTSQCVIFDELYWYKETIAQMQADVHKRLAELRGLTIDDFRANELLEDVIGDPRGGGIAREFGQGRLAIQIRTAGFDPRVKLSDHALGFKKVNEVLTPGFWHCGKRQNPRGGAAAGECAFCGRKPIPAVPLLVVMRGKAPNLVRTLPNLEKKEDKPGEIETEDEKRGQEDHLADTVRYYVMRTTFPEVQTELRDILKEPVGKLTVVEKLERIKLETLLRQRAERDRGERDDNGERVVARGVDGDDEDTDILIEDAEFVQRGARPAPFYDDED